MARPHKQGLEYFPLDVDLLSDVKLRKPKHKYGYLAVMVYIALLCILYKDKGYYIDSSDMEDLAYLVIERLQGKFQPDVDTVEGVIEFLVECELFSGYHFKDKNIITSHRAQCTWYSITANRLQVTVNENFWMLSLDEMQEISTRHSLYKKTVNRSNNSVNQSINPQSKVKESKVIDDHLLTFFGENISKVTPYIEKEIKRLVDDNDVDDDFILHCIEKGAKNGAKSWAYIKTVIDKYISLGIKTRKQALENDAKFKRGSKAFPQREYSDEELKARELEEYKQMESLHDL